MTPISTLAFLLSGKVLWVKMVYIFVRKAAADYIEIKWAKLYEYLSASVQLVKPSVWLSKFCWKS